MDALKWPGASRSLGQGSRPGQLVQERLDDGSGDSGDDGTARRDAAGRVVVPASPALIGTASAIQATTSSCSSIYSGLLNPQTARSGAVAAKTLKI